MDCAAGSRMGRIKNILSFETMITPMLVKMIFWGGVLFALFSIAVVSGDQRMPTIGGACVLIVLLRIFCEVVLTMFKR